MIEVFPAVRAQLEAIPGVVEVGIGIKESGHEMTGEPAFGVYVEEKKPPEEVPPGEMIPAEIAGFPTDVRVRQKLTKQEDTAKYRPLKGGVQIARAGSDGLGTIACFGHLDTPEGEVILLTAAHVVGIMQDDTPAGRTGGSNNNIELGQPSHTESWCCKCNDIAVTVHGVNHRRLDYAIARLKPGVTRIAEIEEIGAITAIGEPMMGQAVKKRGRTTGLTTGNISMLLMNAAGTAVEGYEVKKNGGNDAFTLGGDSGAAVLNNANEIIGLHHEGNGDTATGPNIVSRGTRIQVVLDSLETDGFRISITTGGGGGESELEAPAPAAGADVLWAVELRLRQTEAGRHLWALIERHQREVLHLVNDVRPVTVAWRRNEGPTFLAAIGRSLKEPLYRIPHQVGGVSRVQCAVAIATMLDAHGSERLRADLAQHRALLHDLLIGNDTTEAMFRAWEEAAAPAVSE